MAFDTEKFYEKIMEVRPLVILTSAGVVTDVFIPDGEMSQEHLLVDTDTVNDEEAEETRDLVIETLGELGYLPSEQCNNSEYFEYPECAEDDIFCEEVMSDD